MILRLTLQETACDVWMLDVGFRKVFNWSIDNSYPDGKSRIGSWEANRYFEVKTGATEKLTLSYAKKHLQAATNRPIEKFEYIEE